MSTCGMLLTQCSASLASTFKKLEKKINHRVKSNSIITIKAEMKKMINRKIGQWNEKTVFREGK